MSRGRFVPIGALENRTKRAKEHAASAARAVEIAERIARHHARLAAVAQGNAEAAAIHAQEAERQATEAERMTEICKGDIDDERYNNLSSEIMRLMNSACNLANSANYLAG